MQKGGELSSKVEEKCLFARCGSTGKQDEIARTNRKRDALYHRRIRNEKLTGEGSANLLIWQSSTKSFACIPKVLPSSTYRWRRYTAEQTSRRADPEIRLSRAAIHSLRYDRYTGDGPVQKLQATSSSVGTVQIHA